MIISKLSTDLQQELLHADEIWIAVALLNVEGLNRIRESLNDKCIEHYIIGIDLPSHPDAISKLYRLRYNQGFEARIATQDAYFHPKLYLIRKNRTYVAFIGSANCTNGGLENNVELSLRISDRNTCVDIKHWFISQNSHASPITRAFLDKYKIDYVSRHRFKHKERMLAIKQKYELNNEVSVYFDNRKKLVSMLRICKRLAAHKAVVAEREDSVARLRELLDYPHFRPAKINVEEFFKVYALGHIIAIPKPTILNGIDKFSKQLKHLCDESIEIAERYNRVMRGDLEIRGVKKGLLSKILTVHNPDLYFVENSVTIASLKKYGINLPKGLTEGQRYKVLSSAMVGVCRDAGLENMAVLDYYLYSDVN